MKLFNRSEGPDRPFSHSEECRVLKADPSVEIPWSEVERGHWVAVCQCGEEHFREPVGNRVRLDPLDPKTSRHLGQCEYASESDPAILRLLLKVTDKLDYWWVDCGSCASGWQVPFYGESRVTT